MKTKKILYIGNSLEKHGYTPTGVDFLGDLLKENGFHVKKSSTKKYFVLRFLDMLWAIVINRKWYDVMLIDTYSTLSFYYAYFISRIAWAMGKKYIPIFHGGDLLRREKRSSEKFSRLVKNSLLCVSPSRYLKEEFSLLGYKIDFVPNPVNLDIYKFMQRKKFRPKLLWVRSFHKIYNPTMALEVTSLLASVFEDVELCMVGSDKDGSKEECELISKEIGISNKIKFTGKLSKWEWARLATDYDIFINTTNIDNMPVSVIEAMALGLPVVSTNVGGIPYLINDENGFLCEVENPSSMYDRIMEIIEFPQVAITRAQKARKLVEEFDNHKVVKQWNELLNSYSIV